MSQKAYINVILPLKLSWEPFYSLPGNVPTPAVGERVLVPFAGRNYLGVVSEVDVVPDTKTASRTKEIFGVHPSKTPVLPKEIELWRLLADYYLCSVGEIYKAAYPSVKDESVSPRNKAVKAVSPVERFDLPEALQGRFELMCAALQERPALLHAPSAPSLQMMLALSHRILQKGRTALWLVPEVKMEKSLQESLGAVFGSSLVLWGSHLTPARKREAARRIRSGEPLVVLATRSAIFLPFVNLDLVIVQDEQDSSYKQTSPAPRYNAREAALILSRLHGAKTLLQSVNPSLDTLYNCTSGKFSQIVIEPDCSPVFEIIDSRSQARMRGMDGEVSRRISTLASSASHPAFFKPRRAVFPKLEDLSKDLKASASRGNLSGYFFTDDLLENPLPPETDFLGVFGVDSLLGKMDFRADERVVQTLMQAALQCSENLRTLAIQTREASHSVFAALRSGSSEALLAERRTFSYPPYTRFVDVVFQDTLPSRAAKMSVDLAAALRPALASCRIVPFSQGLRITFRRSAALSEEKRLLVQAVEEFQKSRSYSGHLHFDVDPLG